jgi:DNA-binding response OmpR family regulator
MGSLRLGVILLVEDDLDDAASAISIFESYDFRVHWDRSVIEAMATCATRPEGIVTLLGLPDGSGLDVVDLAREHDPDVPILVIGHGATADDINLISAEGVGVGCKPPRRAVEASVRLYRAGLASFARRVLRARRRRLDVQLIELEARVGLKPRETRVAGAAVITSDGKSLQRELSLSESCFKDAARGVREKTGVRCLEDAVVPIRRRLLLR